jgi:four helix bundle protein
MAAIKRFEEIKAWQKARVMVREVYKACAAGTLSKDYGLKDQICRAAVSSMSNIAEGFGRNSNKDFAHFLDIARGSAMETQSLLYVALSRSLIFLARMISAGFGNSQISQSFLPKNLATYLDVCHIKQETFDHLYAFAEETPALIIGFSSYLRSSGQK